MFAGKKPVFCCLLVGGLAVGLAGCGRPPAVVELSANAANKPADADPSAAGDKPGAADPIPGKPPVLPDDAGGKAVRDLLAPTPVSSAPAGPRGPVALAPPASQPPLPPLQVALPRRALTPAEKGLRPRPPGEDAQSLPTAVVNTPARPAVLTPGPTRVSSPDVNEPIRLGFVGLLTADRVPLDDPTAGPSLRAVLGGSITGRVTPVPFTPTGQADPFQNAETVRLKTPPPEDAQPAGGSRK